MMNADYPITLTETLELLTDGAKYDHWLDRRLHGHDDPNPFGLKEADGNAEEVSTQKALSVDSTTKEEQV